MKNISEIDICPSQKYLKEIVSLRPFQKILTIYISCYNSFHCTLISIYENVTKLEKHKNVTALVTAMQYLEIHFTLETLISWSK